MTTRRPRMAAELRLETLEGRITLSSSAHTIHGLAPVPPPHHAPAPPPHKAPHAPPAPPNPVLVNLTPDQTGITITDATYNTNLHMITIKGSLELAPLTTPPPFDYPITNPITYPVTANLEVTASQAVNQLRSVSGSQSSSPTFADTTAISVPFLLRVVASSGEFESGTAIISFSASDYDGYYYETISPSYIVQLRNVK